MITLVNDPGGLFNCLGKIGAWLENASLYAGGAVPTLSNDIIAQFNGAAGGQPAITSPLPAATSSNQSAVMSIASTLQQMAQKLVIELVRLDNPQPSSTLSVALAELIRQMNDAGDTVQSCIVSATASFVSGNGDAVLVATTQRGDGLQQENCFAETAAVTCIADSYTGGTLAGAERFKVAFLAAQSNALAFDWPQGSGAAPQLTCVDGSKRGSNLLTNSSFEIFTVANVPDNWTVLAGTPGTNILKSTTGFDGNCVNFVSGGTSPSIAQTFATKLQPLTTYCANLWLKANVVPASGVLTIDLVDASNAVIQDNQGNDCKIDIPLTGLTTAFVAHHHVFTTPELLPTTHKLRIRASTAIPGGSTISIDRLALAAGSLLYAGGPYACMFSGATPALKGDAYSLVVANDRAGTGTDNFQTLFDRLFGMRALKLLLPSIPTGETIPASLIG